MDKAIWLTPIKNQLYSYYEDFSFFRKSNDLHTCIAVYFVEKGSFKYRIGNSDYDTVSAGQAIICPPNVNFNKSVISTVTMHLVNVALDGTSEAAIQGKFNYADDKRICDTLERLKGLVQQKDIPTELYRSHLITDLWYSLLSILSSPFTEYTQMPSDPFFCEMRSYIEANLNVTPSGLAEKFACSRMTVNKCFRKFSGCTAVEYIQNERIWKATVLLTQTNEALKSIAPQCGFSNEYYFSKVFRSVTGRTPMQYRREYGKKQV